MLFMMMCVVYTAKAQFYDSANEIYFYKADNSENSNAYVLVFNFDGRKAALLEQTTCASIQSNLKNDMDYYGKLVETTDYSLKYESSASGTRYTTEKTYSTTGLWLPGETWWHNTTTNYDFSSSRYTLTVSSKTISQSYEIAQVAGANPSTRESTSTYTKVDKNYFINGFFGKGRQRN